MRNNQQKNIRKNIAPKAKLLKNQKQLKAGSGNKTQNKKTKVEESRVVKTKKRKSEDASAAKAKKIKKSNVIVAKKNIKKKPPEKMEKKPVKKTPVRKPEKKYDDESPPTLCETFSRIQSIVAETVISAKAEKKLLAAAGIKPFTSLTKVEKKKKNRNT